MDGFEQFEQLSKILKQYQTNFEAIDALSQSVRNHYRPMEIFAKQFSLPSDLLSVSEEIMQAIDTSNMSVSFPNLAELDHGLLSGIDQYCRQLAALNAEAEQTMQPMTDAVSEAVSQSLVGYEAMLRLSDGALPDISALSQIQDSFGQFATKQLDLASEASDTFKANSVNAIAASARLLPEMSHLSELIVLTNSTANLPELESSPVNIFQEIGTDIAATDLESDEVDIDEYIENSHASHVVSLGGRLVNVVCDFNVKDERSDGKPVFKPTTKTMKACHVIPTTSATDERSFLEVVDNLYFMLYEGSGEAKRLTSLASVEKLEALWLLKHLRLGARHDTDHGGEAKSRKNAAKVGAAYNKLIGKPVAHTRDDWAAAQRVLYGLLVDMLDEIWTSVN